MNVVVWLVLCLIWGTTWIFIKIGLRDLPPLAFASARFSLAIVILFVLLRIKSIPLPRTAAEWRLTALTGVLQFALNYSSVFWAEQYITPGLAAVLQATITIFGLVIAWYFLPNEKLTRRKVAAVIIGVLGVAVIFYDQLSIGSRLAFFGCVAIVAGSYCAAQASILIKARARMLHPAGLVLGQMLSALPFIVTYSLIAEGNPLKFRWTTTAIACVLYLTVIGTITAFWLYYWLLRRIESTRAMMISLVTPLIAVIIDAIFLGERLPAQTLSGGVLILTAIALIVVEKRPASAP